MKTILVTGGAGFIGSNFVYLLLEERPSWRVVCVDSLTLASVLEPSEPLILARPFLGTVND